MNLPHHFPNSVYASNKIYSLLLVYAKVFFLFTMFIQAYSFFRNLPQHYCILFITLFCSSLMLLIQQEGDNRFMLRQHMVLLWNMLYYVFLLLHFYYFKCIKKTCKSIKQGCFTFFCKTHNQC